MVDDQEQVLLELSFPEITKALSEKSNRPFMQNFTLTTMRDETFVFQSPNSSDICELVNFFIDGLKFRSKFLIATQDYKADNSTALSFNQGDLMILENNLTGDHVSKQSWVQVKLDRTSEKGDVPTGSLEGHYLSFSDHLATPPASLTHLLFQSISTCCRQRASRPAQRWPFSATAPLKSTGHCTHSPMASPLTRSHTLWRSTLWTTSGRHRSKPSSERLPLLHRESVIQSSCGSMPATH